ncbi:bifunctional folylpolyglutamate synthase/dihydrofolate synthase [Paenisporosarcina indica]|uniref:bifunctional folylpolyglutamate synthase/dihydrofolate synthase n=1 Tax=Paenisporosarcina indica TaxID=650093 RepID=UPI00094F7951|nr:folylpolyglutamate synthase/dihydrofolate synthase family protein [Paenisporosarcina indica]
MIPKFEDYKKRFQLESKNAIEPGLDSITRALEKVGNPHKKLQFVHVAGTNGKGSTIAMMNSMLQAHDIKTACFYSPCFVDVHDQIQLNGQNITKEQLDHVCQLAKAAGISGTVTDFELLTVLAFLSFEQFNPKIVLLETGMGGRFDSTNVIKPLISVIPSIAIEHEQFLGKTIEEVAMHKAGIVKDGIPLIIGPLDQVAEQVMEIETAQHRSPLMKINTDFFFENGHYKDFAGHSFSNLSVPFHGPHQQNNAALAILAVIYLVEKMNLQVNEELIRTGLQTAFIPGRFEKMTDTLYFDGAHNPASAQALVDTIRGIFPDTPIHFYVGMIEGKDAEKILRIFEEISSIFTFIDFPDSRSMSSQKLSRISKAAVRRMTKEPVKDIMETISEKHVTIVTGSLYLLANLRLNTHQKLENNKNLRDDKTF